MMKYLIQILFFVYQVIVSAIYLPNLSFWKHSDKNIQEYLKKIESRSINHKHLGWSLTGDNPNPPSSSFRTNYLCVSLGKGKDVYHKACKIMKTFQMTKSIGWAEIHCQPKYKSSSNREENHEKNNNEKNEFDLRQNKPLCTLAKCFGIIWVLNPCRIIGSSFTGTSTTRNSDSHTISDGNKDPMNHHPSSDGNNEMFVSFSTVNGHLLAGEERFRIRYVHHSSSNDSTNDRRKTDIKSNIHQRSSSSSSSGISRTSKEISKQNVNNYGHDEGEVFFDMYSFSKPSNILGLIALPYVRHVQKPFFKQQAEAMKKLLVLSS